MYICNNIIANEQKESLRGRSLVWETEAWGRAQKGSNYITWNFQRTSKILHLKKNSEYGSSLLDTVNRSISVDNKCDKQSLCAQKCLCCPLLKKSHRARWYVRWEVVSKAWRPDKISHEGSKGNISLSQFCTVPGWTGTWLAHKSDSSAMMFCCSS